MVVGRSKKGALKYLLPVFIGALVASSPGKSSAQGLRLNVEDGQLVVDQSSMQLLPYTGYEMTDSTVNFTRAYFGGLLGGVAGFFVGGMVAAGFYFADLVQDDSFILVMLPLGWTTGVVTVTHNLSGRQGSYGLEFLAASGVGALGGLGTVLIGYLTDSGPAALGTAFLTVMLQGLIVVSIEKTSWRKKHGK